MTQFNIEELLNADPATFEKQLTENTASDEEIAAATLELEDALLPPTKLASAVKRGSPAVKPKTAKQKATESAQAKAAENARQAAIARELAVEQNKLDKELERFEDITALPVVPDPAVGQAELEITRLKAALEAAKKEVAQLKKAPSRKGFAAVKEGVVGQQPLAVIDHYGFVHPWTANHNDRICLLKMRMTYIYNHADLKEALRRMELIQENKLDSSEQIQGARLVEGVADPRSKRMKKDLHGFSLEEQFVPVNPQAVKLSNDPSRI